MKTQIVIIEGPSGVGKDSIIAQLIAQYPDRFQKATSYATRAMRPGEVDGFTYNFTDDKTFLAKVKSGDIFEYTQRHGTYRGLSKTLIDRVINTGKIALKDADIIGVRALRATYSNRVLAIFITASREIIEHRLIKRGDSPDDRAKRLADYDNSQTFIPEFDYVVDGNGPLDETVSKVHSIISRHNN